MGLAVNDHGMPTNVTLPTASLGQLQAGGAAIKGPCVLFFRWAAEDQAAANVLTAEIGVADAAAVGANHVELHPGANYFAWLAVPAGQTVGLLGGTDFDVSVQVVRS